MKLTQTEALNLALAENIHRLNQPFITLAIRQWDRTGQGCFAAFVKFYVFQCWRQLALLN